MNLKHNKPLIFVLSAGILGFFLRVTLYRFGFDERNILSSFHWLHLACLLLTAISAVYLMAKVWKLGGSNDPRRNFPGHPLRSLGCFAAGCLIALHGVRLFGEVTTLLSLGRFLLSMAAAFAMILCPLLPRRSGSIRSLCFGLVTGFFALDMLCRYRVWSGNPQLPDYMFQVLACVLLCLTSYHRLAFDVGLGKRRSLLWCSLMAIYLCVVCVSGPETQPFFLGGALWAGSCMCTLTPPAAPVALPEEAGPIDG